MIPYKEREFNRIIEIFKDEYCTSAIKHIRWYDLNNRIYIEVNNIYMAAICLSYPIQIADDPANEILFTIYHDFMDCILKRFIQESQL